MKIHLIFDFMHIYYKYFFRKGLKRLSAPIDWNGTVIEKDTTLIFHPLSDIESQRRSFESQGNDVTVSVCFDSKSHRNDSEDSDYKSGREHRLSEEDIKNIDYIKERLAIAGHNTYKLDDLTIFMESTGIYHLPVERYFKEQGFNTLVINSLTTKNNYDTLRKTKTDTKDCMRLSKLFFVNEVDIMIYQRKIYMLI